MSLAPLSLDLLNTVLRGMRSTGLPRPDGGSARLLSLGYPDILAGEQHIRQIFGDAVADSIRFRADSADIIRWHGMHEALGRIPDAESLFNALGLELEVMDLVAGRGGEIIADLNHPVPERYNGRYAIVLDAGTLEHCFNIAQAAKNVANLVARGGAAIHGNPLNMFNHGFYNINPTWYHDFYAHNGFVVEYAKLVNNPVFDPRVTDVPPYDRFNGVPDNCVMLVVARRAEVKPITWPTQKKYADNPTLRG